LFAALSEDALAKVADGITVESYRMGEIVIRMGDPGAGFFLIKSGKFRVVDDSADGQPINLALLKKGASFGDRSLIFNQPVSATIRSAGAGVLLKLSPEAFDALVAKDASIKEVLVKAVETQDEYNFLKTQSLLSGLAAKEIEVLIDQVERIELTDSEILFREGDEIDSLYLIKSGEIRLIKESRGDKLMGIRKPGAALGETALVFEHPQDATGVAKGDTEVFRLPWVAYRNIAGDKTELQDLLVEQARNQLLQQQSILGSAEDDDGEGQTSAVKFYRGAIRYGTLLGRNYPICETDDERLGGLACLDMAMRFLGLDDLPDHIAEQHLLSSANEDLYSLSRKSEANGLSARVVNIDISDLWMLTCPMISQHNDGKHLIIMKVGREDVVIGDPAAGLRTMSKQEFAETWDGQLILLSILPNFGASGVKVSSLFKQFIPMLKPHVPIIIRVFAITLLLQGAGLIPPFFSQILIDNVLVVGDWNLLGLLLTAMILGTFFGMIADALRDFLMLHLMRRLTGNLFVRFFSHILTLPMLALQKWDTGALTARFEENQKILSMASGSGIGVLVNTVSIFVYIPVLFVMNVNLGMITMIFVVAMAILIVACAPKLRKFERMEFDAGATRDSHLIEVVSGIGTIKALAQEYAFARRGIGLFKREMEISMQSERFDNKMEFVSDLIQQGSGIVILGLGASMVLDGNMTPGQLIAFTGIVSSVMGPAEGLANFYDEYLELRIALERVNDVLAAKSEQIQFDAVCPEFKGDIRFENVGFSFDPDTSKEVLSDINLEIKAGQKVALVGRSGSGKSTLVNMVNRLLDPTRGSIFIDTADISKLDVRSLRRQIGVVEQSPFIFSGTIRENIAKADPNMSLEAVVSAATLAGAHEFISAFPMGYDTRIGEGGRSMSGGQAQRMIIARALVGNPRILILDEATAALDNETERIIQKNLDKVMSSRTTLVIAHRLSTIRNADMIVLIDNGSIAETGSHDELMEQKGLYYYLVQQSGNG